MNDRQKNTIQPELPNIVGLSHICIFVDDMEQAVDYYRDLLGVEPDHCLSHWKNEGFFKAGGFGTRQPMVTYPLPLSTCQAPG